ncbi:MAG: outer membrane lipoprotein-sorting protein [Tannerellaceae bacterium]|nr:outer membrane lipoprotein-sorting protein [Tannerellaceae bacterium]
MDGRLIPTVMIIVDELQKNTYTRLEYYTIQFSNNKPAEFFTLGGLKR